jgi:NAD(P)-dependent dehydrogenase (short-subunit alcohol dehydrogenase family)
MLLQGKVVLVTGGASGIGRAAARALAREGAAVVVADINAVGGEETVRPIKAAGGQALFAHADVSKASDVEAMVAVAIRAFGGLDCAFNNAGIGGTYSRVPDKTEEEWDAVFDINLKGVWLCMKYEIPAMLERGGGAIVNMASLAGLAGFAYGSAYAAVKHGVVGLTKSAALEYARQNIRVNAVCPGYTDTPMVSGMIEAVPRMAEVTRTLSPMRRLGEPDEIADAVVWLCSDKASFITGHALPLDGGVTAG